MQIKKEEIKDRIKQAALEEFYKKNYKSATMRSIAKRAGITVGLIYTYYDDKEALLEEILSPVLYYIKNKFNETSQLLGEEKKVAEADMIPTIIKWPKELIILFENSAGSHYQNFRESMIAQLAKHIERNLKIIKAGYSEIQSKILAACYLESMLVVAHNYQNKEWADEAGRFIMDLLFFKAAN